VANLSFILLLCGLIICPVQHLHLLLGLLKFFQLFYTETKLILFYFNFKSILPQSPLIDTTIIQTQSPTTPPITPLPTLTNINSNNINSNNNNNNQVEYVNNLNIVRLSTAFSPRDDPDLAHLRHLCFNNSNEQDTQLNYIIPQFENSTTNQVSPTKLKPTSIEYSIISDQKTKALKESHQENELKRSEYTNLPIRH
jgi:hypothetical protein